MATAEAEPILYGEKACEIESIRLLRPHYLGRALIHSEIYDQWLKTTDDLDFTAEQLEQLRVGVDDELVPTTWGQFYDQTSGLYDRPEKAAIYISGMKGAVSAFYLGYAESLHDDPQVRENGLDPLLVAMVRIEHIARANAGNDQEAADKQLGIWKEIFKQDFTDTVTSAIEFIEHLPECAAHETGTE